MTDRLEIASRALQGMLARTHEPCGGHDSPEMLADSALGAADALISAAGQSSDANEMARTIQRLERGMEKAMAICAMYADGQNSFSRIEAVLRNAMSEDTEAVK